MSADERLTRLIDDYRNAERSAFYPSVNVNRLWVPRQYCEYFPGWSYEKAFNVYLWLCPERLIPEPFRGVVGKAIQSEATQPPEEAVSLREAHRPEWEGEGETLEGFSEYITARYMLELLKPAPEPETVKEPTL